MTRSRIAATLAGLACVAIARAEEPPPARGIAEFFAQPGATTMCKPMTPAEAKQWRKYRVFVSEVPRGWRVAFESTAIANGVRGMKVENRPRAWAVDYTWFWIRGGAMPSGVYTFDRLVQLGDSLALPDTATVDLTTVVYRTTLEAGDWREAGARADSLRPAEIPTRLRALLDRRIAEAERRALRARKRDAS